MGTMNRQQIIRSVAIHLVFWIFWFIAPILFSSGERGFRLPEHPGYYFRSIFTIGLFYLNYFWIIERSLFQHKVVRFVLMNVVLLTLVTGFELIQQAFFHPGGRPGGAADLTQNMRPPIFLMLMGIFFSYIFVISIAVAIRTTTRWIKLDDQRKTLENENLKSELNNLKMQLNPHFFFNTLNNIYSLIQIAPERAQEAVHRLARLMRYHLYETNSEKVSLKGEIEFVDNYISLMKMRSTSLLDVKFNYSIEDNEARIAPLLFVPLIENAFKFGISNDVSSEILIEISELRNEVVMTVQNTIFDNPEAIPGHSGIGLENLRKRLSLIYPNAHEFRAESVGDKFMVLLRLKLG